MLFVSNVRHYSTVPIPTIDRDTSLRTGEAVERGTHAEFRPFGIPAWAIKQAELVLGRVSGMGHDENPHFNYSMYDTDLEAERQNWADENRWGKDRKNRVEQSLLKGMSYGTTFVAVEKPKLPAPWPNYSKTPAAKVATTVEELGLDAESVIAYESENKNRPTVIEALQTIEPQVEEVEPLVTA